MSVIAATGKAHKFLIGGDWRSSSEKLEVNNPYGGIAGTTYWGSASDVEDAIEASVQGFDVMKSLPSYKRADLLRNIADKIRERKEDFSRTMTLECGKPIRDSRAEVDRAVMTFTIASEEAKRLPGDTIPLDLNQASEGRMAIMRRFPVGPVLGITPFNFPLNLVAHKAAPALAAGNSIIIKPSPRTPLSSLLLAEVAQQSGAPSGSINVLTVSNELTKKLVQDERIKALSFTGGTDVGWNLKSMAGKKKTILELGGNAAVVIDADADVDFAVQRCTAGAFYYAGQNCISVQRVYIHQSRYDDFIGKFVSFTGRLMIGNPMEEVTDIGPMIDEAAAQRIEEWVNEAVEEGAGILTGGHRNGSFYEPTILEGVDPSVRISCAEAFGPVAIVEPFTDFGDVVHKVNDSRYGLQAGIFTNNLDHAFQAFKEFEVGGVIVNDVSTYRIDHMPYGGIKDSGFGREGVRYTIEELTEIKMLALNLR